MAVALELSYNGPGATSANYNQLLQRLGVSPGGRHPDPDCLFHWRLSRKSAAFDVPRRPDGRHFSAGVAR
jgi:hypothetical protein